MWRRRSWWNPIEPSFSRLHKDGRFLSDPPTGVDAWAAWLEGHAAQQPERAQERRRKEQIERPDVTWITYVGELARCLEMHSGLRFAVALCWSGDPAIVVRLPLSRNIV